MSSFSGFSALAIALALCGIAAASFVNPPTVQVRYAPTPIPAELLR